MVALSKDPMKNLCYLLGNQIDQSLILKVHAIQEMPGFTMTPMCKLLFTASAALCLIGTMLQAETVTVTCTGMLDFDIYAIDTAQETQVIKGIGDAKVALTKGAILLEGAFGVYRFDLEAGTKYHNDVDTGIYCTHQGLPQD